MSIVLLISVAAAIKQAVAVGVDDEATVVSLAMKQTC